MTEIPLPEVEAPEEEEAKPGCCARCIGECLCYLIIGVIIAAIAFIAWIMGFL